GKPLFGDWRLLGLFELGVDHAAVLLAAGLRIGARRSLPTRRARTARPTRRPAGPLVHDARDAVRFLLEPLAHALDRLVVLLLDGLAPFLDERLERGDIADLVLVLADRLFERVAEVVEL